MPLIVSGTKVKDTRGGVSAIRCPGCGWVTTADEHIISAASHVYFIAGRYKEQARTMQCRLCGFTTLRPSHVAAVDGTTVNEIIPSADLIERTNPDVERDVAPELPDLPEDVRREHWAFLDTLTESWEHTSKSLKGWTGGLTFSLGMFVLVFSVILTDVWTPPRFYRDHPVLAYGCVLAPVVLVLWWVTRIHRRLVDRRLHRHAAEPLHRFLDYTESTYDDLLLAAMRLGKDVKKACAHLTRARWRYGV